MKIGIVFYSKTGNTYSVAQKLKNALLKKGHEVSLERVTARNEQERNFKKLELKEKPEAQNYDALIFASPVWGLSLCPIMAAYLAQVAPLNGKKTVCFVTHAFPFAFLGGNRSVAQMKQACARSGAEVVETAVIDWSSKKRENQITQLTERVGGLF